MSNKHYIFTSLSHKNSHAYIPSIVKNKMKKKSLNRTLLRKYGAKHKVISQRATQTAQQEARFTNTYAKMMRTKLPEAIKQLDLEKIKTAYNSGALTQALSEVQIDYGFVMTDMQNTTFNAVASGAGIETEAAQALGTFARIAPAGAETFSFNPLNEPTVAWVRAHTTELIDGLSSGQRAAMRRAITQHYEGGMSSGEMIASIKRNIGLTERQVVSNNLYYQRMLEQGVATEERNRRALRYAERQLKRRAKTIAGDEMHIAITQGRQEMWHQFLDENNISVSEIKLKRTWITAGDEDVCEICSDMNGVTVDLNKPYTLPDGEQTMVPYAHSNCRCDELVEPEI